MVGSVITYDGWPQGRFLQVLWEGACESRPAQCCNDLPVVSEWRQSWGPLDGDQSQVWDCWCQRHCWLKLMPLISCWFSAAGNFPQCLRGISTILTTLITGRTVNAQYPHVEMWSTVCLCLKLNSTLIQILLVHASKFGVDKSGVAI